MSDIQEKRKLRGQEVSESAARMMKSFVVLEQSIETDLKDLLGSDITHVAVEIGLDTGMYASVYVIYVAEDERERTINACDRDVEELLTQYGLGNRRSIFEKRTSTLWRFYHKNADTDRGLHRYGG